MSKKRLHTPIRLCARARCPDALLGTCCALLLMVAGIPATAQNVSVNDSGALPDSSAMLDVSSTSKGILIPRMTQAQRNSIADPANGLMVYQTDGNPGIYLFDLSTTSWNQVLDSTAAVFDLQHILANGNDAGGDSIVNLHRLGLQTTAPLNVLQIDSSLAMHNNEAQGLRWFGYNLYEDGSNLRYLRNDQSDAYAIGEGFSGLFHWIDGSGGTILPSDPASFIRLEDSTILFNTDAIDSNMNFKGHVLIDSLTLGALKFPSSDGLSGQVLETDGSGNLGWTNVQGDNLGNHTASQNAVLDTFWLSNDGSNAGINIAADGAVGMGRQASTGDIRLDIYRSANNTELQLETGGDNDVLLRWKNLNEHWTLGNSGVVKKFRITDVGRSAERLVIDTSGHVGIGTSSPVGQLHVAGDITIESSPPNLDANGVTVMETVDVNTTGAGAALYIATDGNYEEADADNAVTMPCAALAVESGTGLKKVVTYGFVRNDSWSWTPGGLVYVSTATGGLTQTPPSGTGDQVQVVGIAKSSNILLFNPSYVVIEVN